MPFSPNKTLGDAPPATPGLMTTEFWKSLIYAVISLLIGVGAIGPDVAGKYQSIIDSVALIAGAVSVAAYAMSRSKTKAAAVKAAAQVIINREYVNSPVAQAEVLAQQQVPS